MTLPELLETVKRLDAEMQSGPKVVEHVSPEVSNMAYHKMRMLGLTALPKLARIVEIQNEALIKLSKHNGSCDGPIGCMCSAPKARDALAKVQEVCDE